ELRADVPVAAASRHRDGAGRLSGRVPRHRAPELPEGRPGALHRLVRQAPQGERPVSGRARLWSLAIALLCAAAAPAPDDPSAPDTPEAAAAVATARDPPEPRFLSPWVASVPASGTIPSPSKQLGHIVGAAGELTHSAAIQGYVRALAAASPRVRIETIGRT